MKAIIGEILAIASAVLAIGFMYASHFSSRPIACWTLAVCSWLMGLAFLAVARRAGKE